MQDVHLTGKYVVRAEDLPRANKLSCAQRPIKRAEVEKYASKYVMSYGEAVRGWFSQARTFHGEKRLSRAENELSSPGCTLQFLPLSKCVLFSTATW